MDKRCFMLLVCLSVLHTQTLHAQTTKPVDIEQATVFLKGAELFSAAHVNLPAGESEFLFTNIAGNINEQSLIVGADGKQVAIQSATFQNNYLAPDNTTPRIKILKDSIEAVQYEMELLKNKIEVVNEQITVIKENRKVSGENTGLSVAELAKMLDLVNVRMGALLNETKKLQVQEIKVAGLIARLRSQLLQEQSKGVQPGGQVLVKFYSKEATSANVTISYVTPNAGWVPTYDIRAANLQDSIHLFYKANIYQNCGVKWKNVRLTLSSGNPNQGVTAPVLIPWRLAFYMPPQGIMQMERMKSMSPSGAPPAVKYDEQTKDTNVMSDPISSEPGTMNDYVTVDNAGINTTFDIALPYTIASDGQQHLVDVKMYSLPAIFEYYAAPKADKDVFLQALVTNWGDLNLLPGHTNIFYEGAYVGVGYIDMRNVKDTMSFSLGRDKKIIVDRELDKKIRSVKTIGSNVRESFSYNITIRNTRKESVTLELLDQVPLSNDKDLVIEDIQTDGAEYDEATGISKWRLTLKPNEAKKLVLSYTVKYPKGKTVENLR